MCLNKGKSIKNSPSLFYPTHKNLIAQLPVRYFGHRSIINFFLKKKILLLLRAFFVYKRESEQFSLMSFSLLRRGLSSIMRHLRHRFFP